jgi:hypothetical protein
MRPLRRREHSFRDYLRRGLFFFERPVRIAFALASSSKTVVYL